MTETVLFYFPAGAEGAAAARKTLAIQKVRVRTIAPEQTGSAVGWLAGLPGSNREKTAEMPPKEAVLVFCGFRTGGWMRCWPRFGKRACPGRCTGLR